MGRVVAFVGVWLALVVSTSGEAPHAAAAEPGPLRAGAASVDVSPPHLPAVVNCSFNEQSANRVNDPLHAKALALDNGETKLVLVIVDNCMMPRELIDQAKAQASKSTGIPTDHMLIAATHSHSAPAAMGCLGSDADPAYAQFLVPQLVRAVEMAVKNLEPARIGWAVVDAPDHTHTRRWILRSDRIGSDPFGTPNVRANMHPGYQNPNVTGPSGPKDPGLSLLSVQSADGRPIAVLANYSMHYFGSAPISADYFAVFSEQLAKRLDTGSVKPAFVGIMSQGTSGDQQWMNYGGPPAGPSIHEYSAGLVDLVEKAYRTIEYRNQVPLAMREAKLTLDRRVPDEARLAWARPIVEALGGADPGSQQQIYAREAVFLHEEPRRELKLQAIRIGDVGITGIPNEVYAITGLKLKRQSPLPVTFNIELANGADGYIPPPEQHALGGYTTWPARTAGLEVQAEPKIVATLLALLEEVAGAKRKPLDDAPVAYSQKVLESKPSAYLRLNDIVGPTLADASGNSATAEVEGGVALYLDGPQSTALASEAALNRAVHFGGGRIKLTADPVGANYSVECWLYNALPTDARAVTGYAFSRGPDASLTAEGEHFGIGGTFTAQGRLFFFNGNQHDQVVAGHTPLPLKTWNHVVLVREGDQVRLYLNGELDGEGTAARGLSDEPLPMFIGDRNDNFAGFEGKIDELAVYDRPLTGDEVAAHFASAEVKTEVRGRGADALANNAPPGVLEPRDPQAGLAAWHVAPGYDIELVVAEPIVIDPTAIDWGADGRLWVVEMADYPSGLDGNGKPGGRVRFLEDTDNDGRYDRSTLFLEGLNFPNGILTYKKGVLITAAPDILYAEDTDGDGKADKVEPLYTGFHQGNQQLRVNGLRWGLDNWIHCASGSHDGGYGAGSRIKSNKTGEEVQVGSRDFRIRPETGEIDPQSGPSQYGRNSDDWGHWFGLQNSYPAWHYVLADHYLRRNPHYAPPDPRKVLSSPNPKVYAATPLAVRYHSFNEAGRFTSACSPTIYRGGLLFPNGDEQHLFTCEPVHNLVQHNRLLDDGVSFRLEHEMGEGEFDFLASEDPWCRPVMTRPGPDGALWVVDMYRYMIEHPEWLPKEGQDAMRPMFRAGDDRGRLYRVYPTGKAPKAIVRLDKLSSAEMVAQLESESGWIRDKVQQLLLERNDRAAIPALEKLAAGSKKPRARLHAMCTLEGLKAIKPELLVARLADEHPGVRVHALRLAEPMGDNKPVQAAALKLVNDPSAKVRLQLSNTLGQWPTPEASEALARLLMSSAGDHYATAAAMSSLNADNVILVLRGIQSAGEADQAAAQSLLGPLLSQAIAWNRGESLASALPQKSEKPLDSQELTVIAQVFDALTQAKQDAGPLTGQLAWAFDQAREQLVEEEAPAEVRLAAVRLLLRDPARQADDLELAGQLLTPQTSADLQAAVVDHLSAQNVPEVAQLLLASWSGYAPARRAQIITALAGRRAWIETLLAALDADEIQPSEIDPVARQRLLTFEDPALRERLAKTFDVASSADRQQVLAQYKSALELPGDETRGAVVFKAKCATCHKFNDVGAELGPNLASLTDRTPAALMESILDPNRAVESKYVSYAAMTDDGRIRTGILTVETGSSITLVAPEAKPEVILRNEIDEFRSTGKSLMPEGMEKEISPQDLADLLKLLAIPPAEAASASR